ncbi:hypothetical protein jhhlp_004447 [Lomentospora prolificans]|uniref:Dihydrodipicolinate synthase n=1 Tax=Lomentospora prolificans TaxID=41688 RepID=A0A2N3NBL3_9PEZI|nr:hypothetical protein jhhlp_004447 [Lomentospora prolificans]
MPRQLLPGIYAPTQVFYNPQTQDLDPSTIAKHSVRLARAGVAGIVTNGSNGEAVYLSPEERAQVTRITRDALDAGGFAKTRLIVGASDQSVRGTLRLCRDAAEAGGDAVLVMVPSFFKWAMDTPTIERYFTKVADGSPLPVIIYNYPGAVSGIDIDSDTLIRLADHPNIVGTKFTCGNVGKLARVAGATRSVSELFPTHRAEASPHYFSFAGVADFISSSVSVGGSGAIVGAANVFPRACVNVYNLAVAGKLEEAIEAQQELARADWSLTKRAIPGFKAILDRFHGYGGIPREPMQSLSKEQAKVLCEEIAWMMDIENELPDATQ